MTSNEGASTVAEAFRPLHDPAPIIGLLDFAAFARSSCAGRATVRVHATPRGDEPLARLGVLGADELRLDVDAERGTLLRVEARAEGRPFVISEVLEIAFDEVFPEETFVFTPPPGEQLRPAPDRVAPRRDLTIESAVALAPFTVWIPAGVPPRWQLEIVFAPESERPPHLHLHYHADDGTHDLDVAESPAGHPGEHGGGRAGAWRAIEREGRSMEVGERAGDRQPAQVRLELDRTRILLQSTTLSVDILADLAAGLLHAPTRPPGLSVAAYQPR